jgi:multiple sugar transport system ATP-binding protein
MAGDLMATVTLDGLTKVYENGVRAVSDLSVEIEDGEFLVLVGPSGCGKSTALRMIAGLEEISAGTLCIGDRVVNHLTPKDRDIAMVFQNYALYPHMTVYDNIGFALKLARVPKAEVARRVREAARILELEPHLDRKPAQLSGGQRQRVAMGRAIVRQPEAFLMDEPLSNLDAKLRIQMRAEISRLQRQLGTTTVYVTHDQVEAMTMGDRVAVLRDGVLQQIDGPAELYEHPTNVFVAGFIGAPSMNLYDAVLDDLSDDGAIVRLGSQVLAIPGSVVAQRPALRDRAGAHLVVGIRPEDIGDAAQQPEHPSDRRLRGVVELVEVLGSDLHVHVTVDAAAVDSGDPDAEYDTHLGEGRDRACVARMSARSRVAVADVVELAVDTERVHLFDHATGDAIWT